MGPLRIDPQKAMDEALKFNQRIAASYKTLRSLDEVDYGASAKEEIYREDKLVLYRFKGKDKPTAKVPTTPIVSASRALPSPNCPSTLAMRPKDCASTGSRAAPSSVSARPRGRRRKSCTPMRFSRFFTCWLTAVWLTCSSSAARVKLRWRPEASKALSAFSGSWDRSIETQVQLMDEPR